MAKIHYARVDEFWRKEQKHAFLLEKQRRGNVEWQTLQPDDRQTWLTAELRDDFDTFLSIGNKDVKAGDKTKGQAIFTIFSNGIKTNRDSWAYSFSLGDLAKNVAQTIETYNEHVHRWKDLPKKPTNVDDFVIYDSKKISWSGDLKEHLVRGVIVTFDSAKVRNAFYRPFTKSFVYFDRHLNNRRYLFPYIIPTPKTEEENLAIWLKVGSEWPMFALAVDRIPDLLPQGGSQCFPFYTYAEDGTYRRENVTDWALEQFRTHYQDPAITKWDIFHYVYAVLHHPVYRERYAANLKRELPRIPFAPNFRAFAEAGAHLADLHVNYEQQPEYPLEKIEAPNEALDWRVEKMKLSKDKTQIVYNKFLTLGGVPATAFEYRLGNRSALEWVIDQYQVSTDKRSGITNDPNRDDDPQYIVRLIGQVITVSLKTMKIVRSLPDLGIEQNI